MRRLGISIYPDKSSIEENLQYIKLASKYGFTRLFTCLLSTDLTKEDIIEKYGAINKYARENGFEVTIDVNPQVFTNLNLSLSDLSFFEQIYVDVLRLDEAYDGKKEALLTYNDQEIIIELNMSNNISYLNNILDHMPIKDRLYGCHNFYPQRNTGLELDYFTKCSKRFVDNNINSAAFISSSNAKISPWNTVDGLCTLEHHRFIPIDIQAKELWATGLVDDVIIGNCFASEKELKMLGKLNKYVLELDIDFDDLVEEKHKVIALNPLHVRRGDVCSSYIRSTEVRKVYNHIDVKPQNSSNFCVGDIIIGNDNSGKYKCELQIALTNGFDNQKNKIGRVTKENLILVKYIDSWSKFRLIESGKKD